MRLSSSWSNLMKLNTWVPTTKEMTEQTTVATTVQVISFMTTSRTFPAVMAERIASGMVVIKNGKTNICSKARYKSPTGLKYSTAGDPLKPITIASTTKPSV